MLHIYYSLKKSRSTPSLRKTWRRLFGLPEEAEPEFEFVTPEEVATPPNEKDGQQPEVTVADEFCVLDRSTVKSSQPLSDEDDRAPETSESTLVEEIQPPIIVSIISRQSWDWHTQKLFQVITEASSPVPQLREC